MKENRCPEVFKVGQIFTWKSTKGNDVIGIIINTTECFVYMDKTIKDKKEEAMFSSYSLENLIAQGTILWLNNKEDGIMDIGQKVLYNEGTYVIASVAIDACDIISEEYLAIYNIAGVDVRGSGLSTFDAPDGSTSIINLDGITVGYSDINTKDLVAIEGETVSFDRSMYIEMM